MNTNDQPSVVKHSKVVLYVDDTVLLYSAKDIKDVKDNMSRDLENAANWFYQNKLHLNVTKCKWTLFGTNRRLNAVTLPDIKISNEPVEHVTSYKYLGLHFDAKLNWKVHVDYLEKKLRQRLGVLKRIRSFIDQETALLLYNTLIMPIIDYCDTVYLNCPVTCLNRIQRLMLRGGRIILNVPFDYPSNDVLKKLNWLTLHERLFFHTCCMMYKCLNSNCPKYMSNKFEYIDHTYNTRNSRNLKIRRFRSSKGQSSFTCKGAKAWNSLSTVIRSSSSPDSFKRNLLKFIFTKRTL